MPPCPAQRLCVTALLGLMGKDRSRLEENKEMLVLPEENTGRKLLARGALYSAVNGRKQSWVSYSAPSSASARVAPSACDPDGTRPRPSVQGPVGANPESEANGGPESLRKGLNQTEVVPGQQSAAVEAPLTYRAYVLQLLSGQARERANWAVTHRLLYLPPLPGSGHHGSMGTSLVVRVCLPQWP